MPYAVFATLLESSTGVEHDIEAIGRLVHGLPALLVVDAISGAGSTPCYTDRWNIDVLVVGSQKALMLPPGLAMVAVSQKAWRQIDSIQPQAFYFNLKHYRKMLAGAETPWTPAISLVVGLRENLRQIRADWHRTGLGPLGAAGPGHAGRGGGPGAETVCRTAGRRFDGRADAAGHRHGTAFGTARGTVRHQAGRRSGQTQRANFPDWALWSDRPIRHSGDFGRTRTRFAQLGPPRYPRLGCGRRRPSAPGSSTTCGRQRLNEAAFFRQTPGLWGGVAAPNDGIGPFFS